MNETLCRNVEGEEGNNDEDRDEDSDKDGDRATQLHIVGLIHLLWRTSNQPGLSTRSSHHNPALLCLATYFLPALDFSEPGSIA